MAAIAMLALGLAALPFVAAQYQVPQQQQPDQNQTQQNMTQFLNQDAMVVHDAQGQYMAIILDDQGEPMRASGTITNINQLGEQDRRVCLYENNTDQDFINIFQPREDSPEGETLVDPLTEQERDQIDNTATCYQSGADWWPF